MALLLLAIGWHTRAVTAVCFILRVSQNVRNPMLVNSFDLLSASALFWSIHLPLGAVASLDKANYLRSQVRCSAPKRLHAADLAQYECLTVAAVAMRLQIWLMYYCAISSKTDAAWTRDHSALQLVLQTHLYGGRPIAKFMLRIPSVCRLLTQLTVAAEYLLPALLLLPTLPSAERAQRRLGFLGLVGLHLSIAVTCELGPIPFINIAVLLPFIPMIRHERRAPRHASAEDPIISVPLDRPVRATMMCLLAEVRLMWVGGGVRLQPTLDTCIDHML